MTLIIAHRDGWMVADRRIMDGPGRIGNYKVDKIQRHQRLRLLVGCAGTMGNVGLIRDLLDELETEAESVVIKRVANLCREQDGKNDCQLLILTPTRLVEIDHGGGIFEVRPSHGAVGSGTVPAMAWLNGYCGSNPLGLEVAQAAIDYVSSVDVGVGDGIQTESIR